MFKNKSVDVHQFSMIPRADIPRSSFRMQFGYKTSFNAGDLVPVMCEEVLPGDTFNMRMTAFCRLATPIFPVMDNAHLETFFFFVPNRLVWENWQKFMGERKPTPGSSIDYTIPQVVSPTSGYQVGGIGDFFGLPTVGQVNPGNTVSTSALPFRAYNLIFNEWFRDENLLNEIPVITDDGPDSWTTYQVQTRGKRHDYFTSCLPWPQKGGTPVSLPLGTSAPVISNGSAIDFFAPVNNNNYGLSVQPGTFAPSWISGPSPTFAEAVEFGPNTGLFADLSAATAATINQIRQAFQIQRLLERDARGGTRYTEIIRAHFGVVSPDARLQRPEYLGGGHTAVTISPIAQTSATAASGSDTPQGNLAAMGTALAHGHGFTYSSTEHGYIIGLVNVRTDLTYQQGIRRHWSRATRYDFYFPAFSHLGEQAVLSKEIYADGTAGDNDVFGYQERWAEYRYGVSQVTSLMRSTSAGTIDVWHYAQRFASRPTLSSAFITDLASPSAIERTTAVGAEASGQQFVADMFFDGKVARPMPMYSVPGLIDHF